MAQVEEIKRRYKQYIDGGGKPEWISKKSTDPIARNLYSLVHYSKLTDGNGRKLSLAEKFEAAGIPFTSKKHPLEMRIVFARAMLDNYVEAGGKIEDLKKDSPEYKEVHNLKITDANGRLLTMEEKFALLGKPRPAKYSNDVRRDLIDAVSNFLAAGGDIYMPKASLPFYRIEYATYARTTRKNGVVGELAFQTNMREIGVDYSEMYYLFGKIEELSNFKDEDGFVDSYRLDEKMDNFVRAAAYKMGVPIPVFVGLVGNCNLRECCIDAEYFEFVKSELRVYLQTHDDFVGLSNKNPTLYRRIKHISRMTFSSDGTALSPNDVLALLDFEDVENDLIDVGNETFKNDIIEKLRLEAEKKGGKLSRSDIDDKDYRKVCFKAAALGATTKGFFKFYGIDYDGKDNQRLSKVWVKDFPFMKEMRAERDRLMASAGVSFYGGCKKEDLFDALIDASIQAYEKYKSQIYNFEGSLLEKGRSEKYSQKIVYNKNEADLKKSEGK